MTVFSPSAREFLLEQQTKYRQHLSNEHGISRFTDYFEHVGVFDRASEPEALRSHLQSEEYPLESLYQVAPAHGQQVVLVSTNPGMSKHITLDHFDASRHYGRHVKAGTDLEESTRQLAFNLHGYLSKSNGFSKIVPRLQAHLPDLTSPNESAFEEYIRFDPERRMPSFFDEIYFTRVYKYPSPDQRNLTKADKNFGQQTLQRELWEVADPKVVVCTGKVAWKALYNSVETPKEEIKPYNNSEVTTNFNKYNQGGAMGGLFEIPTRNLWVITTKHGSYPPDIERFEDNLNQLRQKL